MKRPSFLLSFFIFISAFVSASRTNKFNLLIAPGALTENSVTILWDKQFTKSNTVYEIALNGNLAGSRNAKVVINDVELVKFTNVKSITGLKPEYIVKESKEISY